MVHELPKLPYTMDALEPFISKRTIEFHYGKHHQAYVNNLNNLVPGTEFENASLDDIVMRASGGIFNNGAQVWNHTFYWNCLKPQGGGEPGGKAAEAIGKSFGSFGDFSHVIRQRLGLAYSEARRHAGDRPGEQRGQPDAGRGETHTDM
jgi:Fe-Mn family superoxide dismutase